MNHTPTRIALIATLALISTEALPQDPTDALAARLADALVDPLIGVLNDRLQRPRLLAGAGALLLGIGMLLVLNPPRDGGSLAVWLVLALVPVYLGFSLASVSYHAWGALLGDDPHQRTRVTASREAFGLAGVVAASVLPTLLAPTLDAGLAHCIDEPPPAVRRHERIAATLDHEVAVEHLVAQLAGRVGLRAPRICRAEQLERRIGGQHLHRRRRVARDRGVVGQERLGRTDLLHEHAQARGRHASLAQHALDLGR